MQGFGYPVGIALASAIVAIGKERTFLQIVNGTFNQGRDPAHKEIDA